MNLIALLLKSSYIHGKVHVSLQEMWVFKLDLFRPFLRKTISFLSALVIRLFWSYFEGAKLEKSTVFYSPTGIGPNFRDKTDLFNLQCRRSPYIRATEVSHSNLF